MAGLSVPLVFHWQPPPLDHYPQAWPLQTVSRLLYPKEAKGFVAATSYPSYLYVGVVFLTAPYPPWDVMLWLTLHQNVMFAFWLWLSRYMVLIHECLYSDLLREDYYEGHGSSGAPQVIPWHLGTSLKVPRHVPRYYFSSFDSATTLEVRRPGPISFLQMRKLSIRSYKVDSLTTEAEVFPSLFLLGSYLLTLLGWGQNYMV